jgi:hypothetical protein
VNKQDSSLPEATPTWPERRHRFVLWSLLIVAAVFASMGRLCVAEFTNWDDYFTVQHNPRFNPPTMEKIARFWPPVLRAQTAAARNGENLTGRAFGPHERLRANHVFGLYIPVTYTVWGILAAVAQTRDETGTLVLNPWVFHSANVALHAAAAVVAFALLRRLVGCDWPAAAGAMLFGLHPVQVESVGWVSGMKDVLCGLLSLAALWQWVEFAIRDLRFAIGMDGVAVAGLHSQSQIENRKSRIAHYVVASIAFLLALLAKPSAVTVPLLALVLDVLLIRRRLLRPFVALLPWFILAAIVGIIAAIAQPAIGVPPAPLWARPLLALDSLAFYLYKLVWPIHLGIDYGRRPDIVITRGWIYFTWLLPVAIAITFVLGYARRRLAIRPLIAAVLIFALAPLSTLGLTTFLFQYYSTVADHYLYVAMLGPALAFAWLLAKFPARWTIAPAATVLALLGVRTFLQCASWADNRALFTHAVIVNPASFMAQNNLGKIDLDAGRNAEAEQHFLAAYRIKNDFNNALENLAIAVQRQGRVPEAIQWYEKYLDVTGRQPPELRPDYWKEQLFLADLLMKERRYDEAFEHYQKSLSLKPGNEKAKQGMEAAWRATHGGGP